MSTSRAVRSWVVSDEGHRWSVMLDVRVLGGHLDTTFHGWSSTLTSRVRLVISRLVLVSALPLDFRGRLRVLRSMFIPGALHGIEASFLAGTSMRKLRAAILVVAWSCRQPFASIGAVLGLLDGPSGCDPAFCVVCFRFRMLRRYLAYRPGEVFRVYRLLERAAEGGPGLGPVHLLLQSAAAIEFHYDSLELAWGRPGLPLLSNLPGPFQHFRAAILGAWRDAVSAELCARKGFRGVPLFDVDGTLQLLNSDHVRERDKALLRSILVGGVWNGFLHGKVHGQDVPCSFCGAPDYDGHLFGVVLFHLPLVEIREHPEFHDLMEMDKTSWPRCLLWHGWLPLLSGVNDGSPWAQSPAEGAVNLLECSLGRYSSSQLSEWRLPAGFDVEGAARRVAEEPDVWTDGSLVDDKMSGVSFAGAGCFTFQVRRLWACWKWGHWDDDVGDGSVVSACRGFCSVPGPLQTVQRTELWCVILALQAVHLGVGNLRVVRHVGRILDGKLSSRPCELLSDGNLLLLIERMLHIRGFNTVRISKVKGHADEALVRAGAVRG